MGLKDRKILLGTSKKLILLASVSAFRHLARNRNYQGEGNPSFSSYRTAEPTAVASYQAFYLRGFRFQLSLSSDISKMFRLVKICAVVLKWLPSQSRFLSQGYKLTRNKSSLNLFHADIYFSLANADLGSFMHKGHCVIGIFCLLV